MVESDDSIFLATEYFELGDLEKYITPELTEEDAKMIGRQLLEGRNSAWGITGLIAACTGRRASGYS